MLRRVRLAIDVTVASDDLHLLWWLPQKETVNQMDAEQLIEIRTVSSLRKTFIVCALIFAGFAIGFVTLALANPDGSFGRPLAAVIVFGGFWGALCILSMVCAAYYNQRWRFGERGIERVGIFPRRVSWNEVSRINVEKNDELKYYDLTIHRHRGRKLTIASADFGAEGRKFLEDLIANLPQEVRDKSLTVIDIPTKRLKRFYYSFVVFILIFILMWFSQRFFQDPLSQLLKKLFH